VRDLHLDAVAKLVQQLPTLAVSPSADAVPGEREPARNDSQNLIRWETE
jgi:hypothetical protein